MGKGFYLTHEAKAGNRGFLWETDNKEQCFWAVYSRNGLF